MPLRKVKIKQGNRRSTHKEIINHISLKLQNIQICWRLDPKLKAAQTLIRYTNVFIEICKDDVCVGSSKN